MVLAVLLGSLLACGSGKDDFIAGRVIDACASPWPVCGELAGCLVGPESYIEGSFPATQRVIVRLNQPSTVTVKLFLDSVTSSGKQITLDFYEDGCKSRVRQEATGREFVQETEQVGWFSRSADLVGLGDHLIEVTSDAQAQFTMEVDVTPKAPE